MTSSHYSTVSRSARLLAFAGCATLAACGDASGPSSSREIAYVANYGSNTVSVIDIQVDSVIATVPVGDRPHGVTVTPDGRFVYVGNSLSEDVTVIETANNTVTATIPTGPVTLGIAVDPSGSFVYEALWGELNAVAVISTATNTVTTMVEVGDSPFYVAFQPNETRAYVSNSRSNDVSVIETTTHTVTATIDLDGVIERPYGMAFSPDGGLLYVASYDRNGQIAVIETSSRSVVDMILGTPRAATIALTHQGSRAYVALSEIRVAVFGLPSNSLLETVPVEAWSLAVARGGASIYATTSAGSVAVIDTHSNTVARTIPVGDTPAGIAIATIQE
jgi:YVTN family beta-propeller protein